ncbi:hypothetical protein HDE_00772 [Halotydeus destructor]|nr:hypothetical protein HDE_00772 [Halotydeus destructor]
MSESVISRKSAIKQLAWSENIILPSLGPLADLDYWSDLSVINAVFRPFAGAITQLESSSAHLGNVIPHLTVIKQEITKTFGSLNRRGAHLEDLETNAIAGLRKLREPMFLAAYLLNPMCREEDFATTGEEFEEGYQNECFIAEDYIRSFAAKLDPSVCSTELEKQIRSFRSRTGIFERLNELDYLKLDPVLYWSKLSDEAVLRKCATRLLFTCPTNADVERSFSMKKLVHSIGRNRLTNIRANDITFCHHHLNLPRKRSRKSKSSNPLGIAEPDTIIIEDTDSSSLEGDEDMRPESPESGSATVSTVTESQSRPTSRDMTGDFLSGRF